MKRREENFTELPEARAGMDDPVTNCFLTHPLFHQSFFWAKQFHGQLIVCWCKNVLKLVPHPTWLGFTGDRVPRYVLLKLWSRTMIRQSWKATWMYWLFPLPPWVFRTGRHRPSPCQCGCWNAPCYRAHRTPYIPAAVQVIVCGKLMLFCQSVFHFDTNSLVWQRLYLVIH